MTPFGNTKFSSATAMETLPNELLLKIISEVVLSSTRSGRKLEQSPHIAGTTKSGWKGLGRAEEISSGIHAVALTSRHLHDLANTVLYRTVVLNREKDVLLFRRTVNGAQEASRSGRTGEVAITSAFLQNAVKRLAITHAPLNTDFAVFTLRKLGTKVSSSDIATIIAACSGAHMIAIPSRLAPALRDIRKTAEGSEGGEALEIPNLTELFLGSYVDLVKTCCTIPPIAQWRPSAPSTPIHSLPTTPSTTRPSTPDPIMRHDSTSALNDPSPATNFHHVTHLCIAEPASAWYSPLALLEVFPSLTHIALPRRAHANTENDTHFIEDVIAILEEPRMRVVVVTIFPQIQDGPDKEQAVNSDVGGPLDIKDSTIWLAAEELRKGDARLFVINGHSGSWTKDWQGPTVVANPEGPGNWWRKVTSA
ncbi:hypothetical protein DEU56DRAFT_726756 [Suillus clintonianus]|uniref:uncharacterized protein n=1 Tax=Suillus clintonianus TaxID=1904413 RepID=UPI001B88491F|nr:uncharacterized protein DEU56DRAFT_726756 [Suillus clintonianus]KAG2153270.1 hypothetical protein DEU56DRAFT_726756 [Suillus clintonianus]